MLLINIVFSGYTQAWIGMQVTCMREWEDGSTFDYGDLSEANQIDEGDSCIRLHDGRFKDQYCHNEYGYICQRPISVPGMFMFYLDQY